VLIFQSDSILCANAPKSVDDFLEWDFVGAPIVPVLGAGYNGGLSLRKVSSTMRVVEMFDWKEDPIFEDQWYYKQCVPLIYLCAWVFRLTYGLQIGQVTGRRCCGWKAGDHSTATG
jgi:hypothetical protein